MYFSAQVLSTFVQGEASHEGVIDAHSSSIGSLLTSCTMDSALAEPVRSPSPLLHHRLGRILLKWLRFYVKFLQSSPLNQEKLLKLLQYSTWCLSMALGSNHKALQALSTNICWARYVTRLLEWPTSWLALTQPRSWCPTSASVGTWMAATMCLYYPMEYKAYHHFQVEQPSNSTAANRWSAWSCRLWLLYILGETSHSLTTQYKHADKSQLLRNALFAIPALHWSELLPNNNKLTQKVTKYGVPVLCLLEALVHVYQSTRNMAVEEEVEEEIAFERNTPEKKRV